MREEPLVSVVLPTRNRLRFLREAVASVRAQSLPRWELLVVDHGSRDRTVAYLERLDDPRVRLLERPGRGNPARLRNEALAEARGRYVALLDSDDLWARRKLEVQLGRMGVREGRQSPALRWRWSYSAVTRIDAEGRPLADDGIQPWRPIAGRVLPELLALQAIVALPSVIVERDLLVEVGGFDVSLPFCEDYDLWFRLAARAPVLAVPQPLATVRVHPENYSRDRVGVHGCWSRVYEKAGAATEDPGLKRLCRTRARDHSITRAALLAQAGARGPAVRTLAGVIRRNPGSLRAWRLLARSLLPDGAGRPHGPAAPEGIAPSGTEDAPAP